MMAMWYRGGHAARGLCEVILGAEKEGDGSHARGNVWVSLMLFTSHGYMKC